VDKLYRDAFTNYILIQILKFSNGSLVTQSRLYFNSSGPNISTAQISTTLLMGLGKLNFNIIPESISVTQTS
ncbi:cell wall protein DAN4-like, partial [Clarias magur]